MSETKLHKRVNVTLPPKTLQLIDRVAPKGDRSRFLDQAVHFYIKEVGRAELRRQLREGAIRRAERDRKLAAEWFVFENETWPTHKS